MGPAVQSSVNLEFVSLVAHELRTALTSLKGYTYIMSRDYKLPPEDCNSSNYKNTSDDRFTMIMQRISISTQRLEALVENLLNITRLQKGTLAVKPESLDWFKNMEEVMAEMIEQAKEKKIELYLIKPQDLPYQVKADKLRINEVLMNLLANAINYTPREGKIAVWLEKKENEVVTHISDTGSGIPQDSLPNLFTKFYQIAGGERQSKGMGLGLYIAKTIVEMHQGRIWVESEVGKGSMFSFSIPSLANSVQ